MKNTASSPNCYGAMKAVTVYLLLVSMVMLFCAVTGFSQTIKDIATDATDPNNLADTEPSIAVDPSNPLRIAVVSFSEPWGGQVGAPVWMSTDGGKNWTKIQQIPQPPTGFGGPGDQKIAFDSTGKVLIAELDFGLNDFVYRQTGASGTGLTPGASYGNDQPHLDVDRVVASPCFNQVYSPWLNTTAAPAQSNIERSSDFGVTVADVVAGNPAFNNRTTRIAVARTGKAYIIYKSREGAVDSNFENAHFRVMRSDDCGATWTALGSTGVAVHSGTAVTWFTNNFGNPAKGKVARARSSDAWIAADPTNGNIYAAFVNKDASGFGQIFVARSTDEGLTWNSTRVTDGTHHSAYPEIAVAGNGAVGVLYVDFDDSGTNTIFRHQLARTFDRNVSWSSVDLQDMDPAPIGNAASGFLWGDYEGLTAAGAMFYGVFTGKSIGRTVLQLDPIFFTAPATQTVVINICERFPEICHGVCTVPGCVILNPIEKYCGAGVCPGCEGGLCPFYILTIEDLGPAWTLEILDPRGKQVKTQQRRTAKGVVISFRPNRQFAGRIGEYKIAFKSGKPGLTFDIKARLEFSQNPPEEREP